MNAAIVPETSWVRRPDRCSSHTLALTADASTRAVGTQFSCMHVDHGGLGDGPHRD